MNGIVRLFSKSGAEPRRAEARYTIAAGRLNAEKSFSSGNIDTDSKLLILAGRHREVRRKRQWPKQKRQ